MSPESTPHEIESALFVCAENPQALCAQIASLRVLAGYRLLPQAPQMIHDIYFDTPERALHEKRLGLRVRQQNTKVLLTLKADAQVSDWGGVTRLERELPWSRHSLDEISNELGKLGIQIESPQSEFHQADPLMTMRNVGLEAVQDRETHRQIRNVVQHQNEDRLAELAIDSLVYHFQVSEVCCYEIEIEQKGGSPPDLLRQLVGELLRLYASGLRKWPYSKLATGMALEYLLNAEERVKWLTADNQLRPAVCDLIEKYMRSEESHG